MSNPVDTLRAILQTNYCAYCGFVNPGWIASRFHKYLCDRVQNFIERETDKAYEIMIIDTPPQHGKSVSITETLPSWILGKHPLWRIIEISYSETFAEKFGRRNRAKINEHGFDIFGISLAKSPNSATEFELDNNKGGMISRGITSGVTGNGANLMIIDDPVKTQQDADSENYRDRIWEEWNSSYKSRLAPGAKIIVIMTRWHEDDLAGRLMEHEKNVEVINLPCEAEENDPLGRKVGEALCPEIGKDDKWLKDFKENYTTANGSRSWNALFQGRPTIATGNLLRREWWQYYDELPEIVDWVMSVDATFKDKEDNDFVAIQVWGKRDANIYLVDLVKKHLDMPSTVREILRLRSMYPECKRTYVEDKANGSSIIQVMRTMVTGIIPVEPEGGKIARVNAVSGAIESGNVHLPRKHPLVNDFVDECASFPRGKHDDQVDSMSQALNKLIYFNSKSPIKQIKDTLSRNFNIKRGKNPLNAIGKGEKINVI